MTTTLFPPVVETYIPAFLRDSGSCRVYFNFSQFNTLDDIAGVHLIVRNQYTNKNMLNTSYKAEMKYYKKDEDKKIIRYDSNVNKYYVILGYSDLISGFEVNESYKVQLRFIDKSINNQSKPKPQDPSWINDNLQNFSEWSTVGIIRGISTPFLTINDFSINNQTTYNDLTLVLSGGLSFSNVKEKDSLQSYIVTLSSGGKVIEKSEKVYTSSLNPNTIYYEFKKLLESGEEYTLKFDYTTRAKYQSSATYYLKAVGSDIGLPEKKIKFTIEPNQERGSIFISIEGLQNIATDEESKVLVSNDTIHLRVRRTSSKSDFTIWETMQEIVLYLKDFNTFRWEDCTVESGVWYRYGFLLVSDVPGADIKYSQFFTYGDLEGSEKKDYIFCPFEDMFLVDKKSNLRIQFNQSVDSMKYVQTENIVTTLGSKYPYIIKGGDTKYKQFNISGMISILEDIEGIQSCACGPDSQKQEFKTDYSNIFFKKSSTIFKELFNNNEDQKVSLYDDYKTTYNISPNNDYVIEKLFRDKVMEFLTDNDVKLFKTMTEGNILVKLTNVSFTPNKTLGRNIYSFSATATEIAEDSVDNYNKFNIVRTDLQTGHFEYMLILPQVPQGSIRGENDEAIEYDIKTKTAEISRGYKNEDETDPHFRLIPMWVFDEEE